MVFCFHRFPLLFVSFIYMWRRRASPSPSTYFVCSDRRNQADFVVSAESASGSVNLIRRPGGALPPLRLTSKPVPNSHLRYQFLADLGQAKADAQIDHGIVRKENIQRGEQ